MNKEEMRARMRGMRAELPEEGRHEMGKRIAERLFDLEEFHGAKVAALYLSKKDEVDTWGLVEEAAHSKEVLLPVVKDKRIMFVYYEKFGEMRRGPYGIMEPVGAEFGGSKIDVMVVPGLAFDLKGNRLGMGKGYYDRYLGGGQEDPQTGGRVPLPAVRVGLCFDSQVVEGVPVEAHDVPVDIIITNNRVIRCSHD